MEIYYSACKVMGIIYPWVSFVGHEESPKHRLLIMDLEFELSKSFL